MKARVRAGLGVALVSDLAVKDEVAGGTLAVVPVEGFEKPRDFHLVSRKDAWLGPAARAFRDVARERAA